MTHDGIRDYRIYQQGIELPKGQKIKPGATEETGDNSAKKANSILPEGTTVRTTVNVPKLVASSGAQTVNSNEEGPWVEAWNKKTFQIFFKEVILSSADGKQLQVALINTMYYNVLANHKDEWNAITAQQGTITPQEARLQLLELLHNNYPDKFPTAPEDNWYQYQVVPEDNTVKTPLEKAQEIYDTKGAAGCANREFISHAIMSFAEEFGLENFSYYQVYAVDAAHILSAVSNEIMKRNYNVTFDEMIQIVKNELHMYLPTINDIKDVISNTPGGAALSDSEKEQKARAISAEVNAECRRKSEGVCSGGDIHRVIDDSVRLQIINEKLQAHFPELYEAPAVTPEPEPGYVSQYADNQPWTDIKLSDFIEDTLLTQGIEPTQELKDKLYIAVVRGVLGNNLINLSISCVTSIIDILMRDTTDANITLVNEVITSLMTNGAQPADKSATCGDVRAFILSILENM